MLVRQQWFDLRMVQKPGHELREHIAVLQPLAVLGEGGRVPDRIVRRQSHEPAIQKIVVQLLHQLAFRADAVEHLQQQGAQQLLRRDRRTSLAGVEPPRLRFKSLKTSRTSSRTFRSGWFTGTRLSGAMYENRPP